MMAFQGINVRQTGDRLLFRELLQDSSGAIVTSGDTDLQLYELQSDGSLKSYDFNDNTFKTSTLTTETQALTHRTGNSGATNTGIWTYALTTLTGFTEGNLYFAWVTNSEASPEVLVRSFQFGVDDALDPFDDGFARMLKLFQLLLRDDVDSDLSATLALINADEGSGVGSYTGADSSNTKLKQAIDSISGGSGDGARTVTITVDDGTDPLENATVRMTEGANTYTASTNVSGVAVFNLDDATYTVSISKAGYYYSGTTLVVDGTEAETYSMTQNSFTVSDPGFITGLIKAFGKDGEVESGVVFTIKYLSGGGVDGLSFDANRTATSGVDGIAEFANLPLDCKFIIWRSDSIRRGVEVTAPSSGSSFNINEVIGEEAL